MKIDSVTTIVLLLSIFFCISCEPMKDGKQENNETVSSEPEAVQHSAKAVVFFGNSLTAGYGVDPGDAFPAIIQNRIDSLGLNYKVVNAGLSGETTAAGKNRIDWILRQPVDIFVLELGANDGLRGISPAETKSNLQEIINKVQQTYPEAEILLVGMQMPPSMGPEYTAQFREVYPQLASENDVRLVPFLLEGVGGEREFNLQDGIHPNEKGHKILAENVWVHLMPMLES